MTEPTPWTPYPETLADTPLGGLSLEIFQPLHHHVVMGASGKPEREVYEREMAAMNVPLHKRKGGGGTVLLGPETIVVTVHAGVVHRFHNLAYFKAINHSLIEVMNSWRNLDFAQRGISDIAVDDRKIVGSSIFRRRQYLLYQASILVELNLDLMNALLRPPPKQPDYRRDRDHASFVTCLRDLGIERSFKQMIGELQAKLPRALRDHLKVVDEAG